MIKTISMVEVELLKPHTHARKELAIGDKITVDSDTAKWLVSIEVGKLVKAEPQEDLEKPAQRSTAKSSVKGE